jgi:hypothetical protein
MPTGFPFCCHHAAGMDVQHVATVVHLWRSGADEKYAGSERYEI